MSLDEVIAHSAPFLAITDTDSGPMATNGCTVMAARLAVAMFSAGEHDHKAELRLALYCATYGQEWHGFAEATTTTDRRTASKTDCTVVR